MRSELPSDGLPTRRPPGVRGGVRSSLRSRRWRYTLKCLAALVGCTVLALFVVDHGVLAWIEAAGKADPKSDIQLATRSWQQENARINENNVAKVLPSPDDWIWQSRGFPASEERSKPHRILVVGDSFVWGDGYANMNDLWWRQLERELRRRGYQDVEVIGLGFDGASTRQQLDHLRNALPRYRPDLVIWGYVTNDADEGFVKQFDYQRLNDEDAVVGYNHRRAERGWLRRLNFQLEQRRREKLLRTLAGPDYGYEYQEWEYKLLEPANLAVYEKTVREVADFMRAADTPYFFMTLPNHPDEKSFRARHGPIKPIFANAGVPFEDILDDFVAAYPVGTSLSNRLGWGINPANGHPGVVSTRFYARKAADVLERSHASVLGPRGAPETSAAPEINDWMPAKLAVQTNTTGQIRFEYPSKAKFLRMPLEQDHVQLFLSMPTNLHEIRLAGPNLVNAQIHLTRVNEEDGIDDGALTSLPQKNGSSLQWAIPGAEGQFVNTVRVVAEFAGPDRSLTLDLVPQQAP